MEKKTTQRIIGMLVVIALVIIMLPLFLGKNELAVQAATVKASPIPNQQATVADSSANSSQQEIIIGEDGQPVIKAIPETDKQLADNHVVEAKPEAAPVVAQSDVVPAPAAQVTEQPVADVTAALTSSNKPEVTSSVSRQSIQVLAAAKASDIAAVKPAAEEKPAKNTLPKAKTTSKQMASNETQTLTKLKSPAWVVQMGSFNDKNNARRLADKLRSSGYKAFTREIKSAKTGNISTRVYVGPEFKQVAALELSGKIAHDLSMHGIVVNFKALEL